MSPTDRLDALLELARSHGAALAERRGVSGTVGLVVGTDRHVSLRWHDGRLVDVTEGAPAEAELELSLGSADAAGLLAGEVEPSVAFMRGRLKTAGSNGLVLELLGLSAGGPFEEWRRAAVEAMSAQS